jgi:hypothetical protein
VKIWQWRRGELQQPEHIHLGDTVPALIICGGGFNVDNPAQALDENDKAVEAFFDFIITHIRTEKEVFKRLICGHLQGKLELNYFLVRKLLGLISAVPGDPSYPQEMRAGHSGPIDIFEIAYSATSSCFRNAQKIYQSTKYFSEDARECAQRIFGSIIEQHKKNGDELCKKLQHITFFGISHGSIFLIELENALNTLLQDAGFDTEACEKILSHIVSVAVSSIAPVKEATGARFTTVYFEGMNDKLAQWINPYKAALPDGKDFAIHPLARHRLLVLSRVIESAAQWKEVIPGFDYFWINNDKAAHYTPFYTLRCLPENIQPELVERVLRNAVRRHSNPISSMHEIFAKSLPLNPDVVQLSSSPEIDALLHASGYG